MIRVTQTVSLRGRAKSFLYFRFGIAAGFAAGAPRVGAAGPTGPGLSSHARKGVDGSWLNAKGPKDRQ